MFLKIYFTFLLLSAGFCLDGQTLELEWATEYADVSSQGRNRKLLVDTERNVYVCGENATPSASSSFLFLKYDSLGNFSWDAAFDNPYPDLLNDCVLTETGLIAGGTSKDQPGGGTGRAIVISYDEEGEERYLKSVFDPQDYLSSLDDLIMDSEGYLYAAGLVCPVPCENLTEETKSYIAKIDPATGTVIWINNEFSGSARLAKIVGDKIRVYGPTKINTVSSYYLREMDLDGNVLDSAFFPVLDGERFFYPNGDLITANDHICKMTIAGDTAWCYDFLGGQENITGQAIAVVFDKLGNIFATGWGSDTTFGGNFFTKILKINNNGELLWSQVDDFSEDQTSEVGVRIATSDDYVFVCSEITYGEYPDFTSDYRPILYSQENGDVLFDTLIDIHIREIINDTYWDGKYFYLTGRGSNMPSGTGSIALFKFSIDEPVATKETSKQQRNITVSPNPFEKSFDLLIEAAKSGEVTVSVFSSFGQRVCRYVTQLDKGGNNLSIEGTDKWPDGFYFVAIEMEGRTYTEKIVKTD
ncbi:MAG TPA: T9SS type A sorting domain-containing protein [Bacteroidetes bacterium]|nr:T9SS type A sorting domain-containing protein [Bacteroidota bacterium]